MSFNYIIVAFPTRSIPFIFKVKGQNSNYCFAPLSKNGDMVFTADADIIKPESINKDEIFCPSRESISNSVEYCIKNKTDFIFALSNSKSIERPGSNGCFTNLEKLEFFLLKYKHFIVKNIGYDVIDSWTGISALFNIGYEKSDIEKFKKEGIKTNEFGLLKTSEDAMLFEKFATEHASEHAPYMTVEIFVHNYGLNT